MTGGAPAGEADPSTPATQPSLFDDVTGCTTTVTPPTDLQRAESLLDLIAFPGIGSVLAVKLARRFATWEELATASAAELAAVGKAATQLLGARRPDRASSTGVPAGTRMLGFFDEDFPELLRDIPSPPAVLWLRGSLNLHLPGVALVGSRQATPLGIESAVKLAQHTIAHNAVVVSGLALGIDGAAHHAAVHASGHTTAVLPSGIDVTYPPEHARLAEQIVEAGGGLVTELPPGSPKTQHTPVRRNRLQSGLSGVVVVVQCGLDSGTLHTAGFALKQGRRLAAMVPPNAEPATAWAGNAALLHSGGRPTPVPVKYKDLHQAWPAGGPAAAALHEADDLTSLLP